MAKKAYVWDGSNWITIASGALDLNEYLKLSTASSIYLSKSAASATYLPISASSNYLLIETASAIYLSIEDAEDTYIPITASANIISGLLSESNAANIYAPLVSASLTGTPFAPTAASGTNTQQIATTEFVRTEISGLVNSAPSTLDTLNELALALGNDANFASSTASVLANKLDATTASTLYLGINDTANHANTASSINWTGVTNTPTTLSGYGITDALPMSASSNYLLSETASVVYLRQDSASSIYLPISATATLGGGGLDSFLLMGA